MGECGGEGVWVMECGGEGVWVMECVEVCRRGNVK